MIAFGALASIALIASPALSEQFSVAGNVEVVRLCLAADDYLSEMVNAVDTVGSYIEMQDIEGIRQRAIAKVDDAGLADDFRLFSFVAGPNALAQVGGDGIALRAIAFDLMECATYACKDENSAFILINRARDLTDQLVTACVQDFRGQL